MKFLMRLTLSLSLFLLTACSDILTDYKLNTYTNYLDNISLLDYINEGQDSSLTLYAEAIEYADAEDILSNKDSVTRIVPTNKAIRDLLSDAGVSKIQDLSKNVVRELFAYLVIPGSFQSIDLEVDEIIKEISGNGDTLFLTREASERNAYSLYVNQNTKFSLSSISVIRQDYVFKDGVAQIVDQFPLYKLKTKSTDDIPEDIDYSNVEQDTLWVQSDSHVVNAYKDNNVGDGTGLARSIQLANTSYKRYGFFKFKLNNISFLDNLSTARLNFYVLQTTDESTTPTGGLWETDTNWDELGITWNNMPEFNQHLVDYNVELGWNTVDLTNIITKSYQEKEKEISLGLKLYGGTGTFSGTVFIRSREQENGDYKAFISLIGPLSSELEIAQKESLEVQKGGVSIIDENNLLMEGSNLSQYNYTDNNIIYILVGGAENGILTKNHLPLGLLDQFTQEELKNGAIKYFNDGNGNMDSVTFKIKDYTGGVYEENVTLTINLKQ